MPVGSTQRRSGRSCLPWRMILPRNSCWDVSSSSAINVLVIFLYTKEHGVQFRTINGYDHHQMFGNLYQTILLSAQHFQSCRVSLVDQDRDLAVNLRGTFSAHI